MYLYLRSEMGAKRVLAAGTSDSASSQRDSCSAGEATSCTPYMGIHWKYNLKFVQIQVVQHTWEIHWSIHGKYYLKIVQIHTDQIKILRTLPQAREIAASDVQVVLVQQTATMGNII